MWPGFGENSRVLAWVFRRCDGTAEADETPIGLVPPVGEGGIDTDGLDVSAETMAKLLEVDAEGWKQQLPQMHEHYAQFGDKLPQELRDAARRRWSSACTSSRKPATAAALRCGEPAGRCRCVLWGRGARLRPVRRRHARGAGRCASPRRRAARGSAAASGWPGAAGRSSRSPRSSWSSSRSATSGTATGLTYLALIAVPLLAAVALGWAMRGAATGARAACRGAVRARLGRPRRRSRARGPRRCCRRSAA